MNLIHFLSGLADHLAIIGIGLAVVIACAVLTRGVIKLSNWRYLTHRKLVCLELTPPAFETKTSLANEQLFIALHGLHASRSWQRRVLKREAVLSLELAADRANGIRYHIITEPYLVRSVQRTLAAHLPSVKVLVHSYVEQVLPNAWAVEFEQTEHWMFPLALHQTLDLSDPMPYLLNTMTQLQPEEQMTIQFVISPTQIKHANELRQKVVDTEDVIHDMQHNNHRFAAIFGQAIASLLFGIIDLVSTVFSPTDSYYRTQGRSAQDRQSYEKMQVARHQKPARQVSQLEQKRMDSIHAKLAQPAFRVSVRAYVSMQSRDAIKERVASVQSAFESYSDTGYQSLRRKPHISCINRYRCYAYLHRLPSFWPARSNVLSASELASLFHFSVATNAADNTAASLSRTLAAPISLKQGAKFDVILGQNDHHNEQTLIGLTAQERERHVYIIGGTGNGKTTMLQYGIVQDMQNGKGVAIVDPHGDLAETLLWHVPEHRLKDVIYFNPRDISYPIGLNLLEQPSGLSEEDLLVEQDFITESIVSIFRKIFSDDDSGGHRIEHFLRNTIHTAFTVPDATLFTVYKLLLNTKFRKSVVSQLKDEMLLDFWKGEFNKAGDYQKVKMSSGVNAKLGRFQRSAVSRRVLEQPKSTIDFDDIIQNNKILICNFSKGRIGEDTSELFGITILAKLQLAAYRRIRMAENERTPFHLYVDEFQNFATTSFIQMLSESRKYKLFLTMAEQSTSQQEDQKMVSVILANVGTVVCFRTGNPQDERLLLPLFSPYLKDGAMSNLPAFNFYVKLSAIKAQEPSSGITMLLSNSGDGQVAERAIELSRENYAHRYEQPEVAATDAFEKPKRLQKKPRPPKDDSNAEDDLDDDLVDVQMLDVA